MTSHWRFAHNPVVAGSNSMLGLSEENSPRKAELAKRLRIPQEGKQHYGINVKAKRTLRF